MAEANNRKRSFSFSSEAPVDRWFGREILDHSSSSVRMGFMKSGRAPFLLYHDQRQIVGIIESAAIGRDKMGRGEVRFGSSDLATRALADVDDGILVNTSVGYRVYELVLESQKSNGDDTYRCIDWEPFEASGVGVPADPTVGMDRESRQLEAGPPGDNTQADPEARISRASSFSAPAAASLEQRSMADSTNAAAGTNAGANPAVASAVAAAVAGGDANRAAGGEVRVSMAPGPSALEMENMRVGAIRNYCKSMNFDSSQEARWISSGMDIEKVSNEMTQIIQARGKANEKKVVSHLDLTAAEVNQFSILRAIRAVHDKDWSKAGFEADCSREIGTRLNKAPDPTKFYVPYDVQQRAIPASALFAQQRALSGGDLLNGRPMTRADVVGTLSTGGYLVATQNISFIELLRNRSVLMRMGATTLTGLVGNVNVPKQTGAASAFWATSETMNVTENEQTFGQMSLVPKTVGAYTEISRLLLLQSSPDVEGIVNADLAAVVGLAVDTGGLNGSGSAGQPTGIINTSGVGTAAGMSTIAYAGQLNFQVAVANANVTPVRGGYATTPTVAALLMQRTRFANTATPLWDGNLWDANGALQCAGFPGMSSKQIPAGNMLFGAWETLVIGEWGVLEIEVNPYAGFQAGIIGIRALMTCDVGLRYPAAFCLGTSIT
jgi:HK97 family phage major capsid protein